MRLSRALQRLAEGAFDKIAAQVPSVVVKRGKLPLFRRSYLTPATDDADAPGMFLHRFVASDGPELHNHPWAWALSFILIGRYKETRAYGAVTPKGYVRLGGLLLGTWEAGQVNCIRAMDFHRLELLTPEVWTLFVHGPRTGSWGFVKPVPHKRQPIKIQKERTRGGR